MKKNLLFYAIAITLFHGCQKPEVDGAGTDDPQFLATVENFEGLTKTSKTDGNLVVWSSGDRIAIFKGCSIACEYVLAEGSESQCNGAFDRVIGGDSFVGGTEIPCNVAMYPYAEGLSLTGSFEGGKGSAYKIENVMLPAIQNYSRNSFGNGSFPMVAMTDNEDDYLLRFKNVLGAVKLQLKGSKAVKSIKIEGKNGEILSGSAVVTVYSDNQIPSIAMIGSDKSSESVTLNCGEGVQLNNSLSTEFIIALPPVTFSKGFIATVIYTDNTRQAIEAAVENAILRSSILVMPESYLEGSVEPEPENPSGICSLFDTGYSLYYDNSHSGLSDEITIVLSNGACSQEYLGLPYLVSDGDMAVITINATHSLVHGEVSLPTGEFNILGNGDNSSGDTSKSYVVKSKGFESTTWDIKSGSVIINKDDNGIYTITTENLILKNESEELEADYVCKSAIVLTDYNEKAPFYLSVNDDIINMPFPYMNSLSYGNLYGNGTGNFVVSMATKGFIVQNEEGVEEMTDVAGVYLTLNFFSRLYVGNAAPVIEAGRYDVSSLASDELLSRWTLFPGVLMDGTPFGSYVLQQPAQGEGTMEYISGGYVDVQYPETEPATKAALSQYCVMTFDLKTSSRKIKGVWKGYMPVTNLAESSTDSYLTTLDHDVECDMSKATEATLTLVETLHRQDVKEELDYDIAEAWRLFIAPRDWTTAEYEIPWIDEDNPKGADGIEGTDDDWIYD